MKPVPELVEGLTLDLRLVALEDAAYIHSLRVNPAYNAHLSEVLGGVEGQREWIEKYKKREANGLDYYFVVLRKDGVKCGTIRIYDIENEKYTWGSWILDESKPRLAALESAFLCHIVGFEILEMKRAISDVRHDNTRTIKFIGRLGAVQIGEDDVYETHEIRREAFLDLKNNFLQFLEERQ